MAGVTAGGIRWNVEQWGPRRSVLEDPASAKDSPATSDPAPASRASAPGSPGRTPLLILHGFTGLGWSWRRFAERFSSTRLCLAPDLPGHGRSEPPPEGFDLEKAARALAQVLDAFAVPRAGVLGYSMGGRLALQFAVLFPERIERLAIVGAAPGILDEKERAARVAADEDWAAMLEKNGLPSFVKAWMAQPLFSTYDSLPPERLEEIRLEKLSQAAPSLAAALRAFGQGRQKPLHAGLAGIHSPVLLVAGEKDEKYRDLMAKMASNLAHARVAIIADAGHAPQIERPEAFFAAVAPFLEAAASKE